MTERQKHASRFRRIVLEVPILTLMLLGTILVTQVLAEESTEKIELAFLSSESEDPSGMTAEEKGLAVAREADLRDTGFRDFGANLVMTLRNRHGEESSRRMRTRTLEMSEDGDKSLVIFDEPRDVKGTAFLSFTHKAGSDDQWLYLPALKRVKRISSNNKSGPFMGSEFAYEDITSQEVEKYNYKYLRKEDLDNLPTVLVERYPVDSKSGYTRQLVWYDLSHFQPVKVEFYDRKDELLKTLTYHHYQPYIEKYWRAERMEMVNHQTGKSTTLLWNDYAFSNGYTDRDFDRNSLKRAR